MNEAGIKRSHAYMIASRQRSPSLPLALHIYQSTGLQLGPIAGASEAEISALTKMGERAA